MELRCRGKHSPLLVPNVKGGASGAMTANEKAQADSHYAEYMQTLQQLYPQLGVSTPGLSQYWGEQPGTSGPVYVGAFVCMLFILSLFYSKGSCQPLPYVGHGAFHAAFVGTQLPCVYKLDD